MIAERQKYTDVKEERMNLLSYMYVHVELVELQWVIIWIDISKSDEHNFACGFDNIVSICYC